MEASEIVYGTRQYDNIEMDELNNGEEESC
jgi:hypothetical protein